MQGVLRVRGIINALSRELRSIIVASYFRADSVIKRRSLGIESAPDRSSEKVAGHSLHKSRFTIYYMI
jgi:hypothetical protein